MTLLYQIQKEYLHVTDELEKKDLTVQQKGCLYEQLMRALFRLDRNPLTDMEDEWRAKRKQLVKDITALQDVLQSQMRAQKASAHLELDDDGPRNPSGTVHAEAPFSSDRPKRPRDVGDDSRSFDSRRSRTEPPPGQQLHRPTLGRPSQKINVYDPQYQLPLDGRAAPPAPPSSNGSADGVAGASTQRLVQEPQQLYRLRRLVARPELNGTLVRHVPPTNTAAGEEATVQGRIPSSYRTIVSPVSHPDRIMSIKTECLEPVSLAKVCGRCLRLRPEEPR